MIGVSHMSKNYVMLKNLKDLSEVTLKMQGSVNQIFEGKNTSSDLVVLKKQRDQSEELTIKCETDLSNAFFLFMDKEDFVSLVNIIHSINQKLYTLGSRRLLLADLPNCHIFNSELKYQSEYAKLISEVLEQLASKVKFVGTKPLIKNSKAIRDNFDESITKSLREILVKNKYDKIGSLICERETLQTFETILELMSKFSIILSELAIKYE
jgi:uncharacterized protein Yka (UPF0111/DUF47 family)